METAGDGSTPRKEGQVENSDKKVIPMDWIKDLEKVVRQLNTVQRTEDTQKKAPEAEQ